MLSPSNKPWSEWCYPISEIEILSTVLGRGAFGEVHLAKWRGTSIAAKKLHVLTNDENAIDKLYKEIELM